MKIVLNNCNLCNNLLCVSFGHPLASTCVDFGRVQIWTQEDASGFFTVWHKLIASNLLL